MAKVVSRGWRYATHGGSFRKILKFEDFSAEFANSNGNAILRMAAAPVGELDLAQIRGTSLVRAKLPAVAGSTGVGIVTDCSGDCKHVRSGDRVIMANPLPGSWATHQVSSEQFLFKVPESVPLEYASLYTVGPLAAYRILKQSGLQKGQGVVVNGANTLVGLCTLQLAKHLGFNAVGVMECGSAEAELQLEKMKQMGLNIHTDPIGDVSQVFGAERPALAVNLVGGYSAAHLASLLGNGGKVLTVSSIGNSTHVFGNDLVEKGLSIQGFPVHSWLTSADRGEVDSSIAEISDLINSNKLKIFILRHELANAQLAIEDAQIFPYNVVILHEGTEKTWPDKARDEYMKIDEKLQRNWDGAAAAQEPFLKAGREQPWSLAQGVSNLSQIDAELRDKLAAVETEEQLQQVLASLSPSERRSLGMPDVEALTLTPEEIKRTIAELQKLP
eukprot:RCo048015